MRPDLPTSAAERTPPAHSFRIFMPPALRTPTSGRHDVDSLSPCGVLMSTAERNASRARSRRAVPHSARRRRWPRSRRTSASSRRRRAQSHPDPRREDGVHSTPPRAQVDRHTPGVAPGSGSRTLTACSTPGTIQTSAVARAPRARLKCHSPRLTFEVPSAAYSVQSSNHQPAN
jgi:hypothetical protein